jgi:hemoglobin
MKIDQISDAAIERLVEEFYIKIRNDGTLAPIFDRAIPGDWEPHLSIMRDFWSSVMMTSGRYKGNPVTKHLQLVGMEPVLFEQWLKLFRETCDELFEDNLAKAFVVKAERIAESLKLSLFYRPDRSLSVTP